MLKKYLLRVEKPDGLVSQVFYHTSDYTTLPFSDLESVPIGIAQELNHDNRLIQITPDGSNPTIYKILPVGTFARAEMTGTVKDLISYFQHEVTDSRGRFISLVEDANPLDWLEENLAKLVGTRVRITIETLPDQEVNYLAERYLTALQHYQEFMKLKPFTFADGKAVINFITTTTDRFNKSGNVMNRSYYIVLRVNGKMIYPQISEDGKILSKHSAFICYTKETGLTSTELKVIVKQAEIVRKNIMVRLGLDSLHWEDEHHFNIIMNDKRPNVSVEIIR